MNKTEATKVLSSILRNHNYGDFIPLQRRSKLTLILRKANVNFNKYSYILVDKYNIKKSNFSSKTFFLCKEKSRKSCIPFSKSKILSIAYPPKRFDPQKAHRADVIKTLRFLISPQIEGFRKNWVKRIAQCDREQFPQEFSELTTCPLSGKSLLHVDVAIDHEVPFIKLVEDWMGENNLKFTDLIPTRWNKSLKDKAVEKSWLQYHFTHAKLQPVEKKSNILKSDNGR